MNTFTIKFGSFIALVLLTIPTGAQAYRFVDSNSVRISETTYLLTHTYTMGFLNEDVMTPIVATYDYESEGEYPRVGFSVEGINQVDLKNAEINALVLSKATIKENQYQTVAGKRSTFTIVALVTLQKPVSSMSNISLSVRTLPFSYTRDGEKKNGFYNLETTPKADEITISAGKQ